MKVEVHLLGGTRKIIDIDPKATLGATIGTNVFNSDGSLFVPPATETGEPSVTFWELIANIPPNVTALANTSTTGLYAITGAGTSATRAIDVAAGELTVVNGSGVAGNPTLGLADVTPTTGGTIQRLAFDTKGRRSQADTATTDNLTEGATNLYFTMQRVRDTVLTGISFASSAVITAADTVLSALGKLQAQISGKEPAIAAGTTAQFWRGDKVWSGDLLGRLGVNAANVSEAADGLLGVGGTFLTDATNSVRGIRVDAVASPGPGLSYCNFDAAGDTAGANNVDHLIGFQSRPRHVGSGVLTHLYSFGALPAVNAGTATNVYGHKVFDCSGAGAVTNQYGLYVDALAKGANNYAIWIDGNNPSVFGGLVGVGVVPDRPLLINADINPMAAGTPAILINGESNKERVQLQSAIGDPIYIGCRTSGTKATPAATPSGALIAGLIGIGHNSSVITGRRAGFSLLATEAWTPGANGTRATVETTPTGATSPQTGLEVFGAGNVGVTNSTGSYGGGARVIFIQNAATVPSSNPAGGGILYVEAGALKYRGSSGTVTVLAPA